VAAQQNNLPVLYCNSFFVRDVHGEFGLINVHLFDILAYCLQFRLEKSGKNDGFFSVWRVLTLYVMCMAE